MIPGTPKVVKPRVCSLFLLIPLFNSRPASTWYQSKTLIPTPTVTPTKPENKDFHPNPMTKINFIYLPHEICAAAAEAATKAITPSNIPTQTKPIAKPTIPLRARLWIYPQQHSSPKPTSQNPPKYLTPGHPTNTHQTGKFLPDLLSSCSFVATKSNAGSPFRQTPTSGSSQNAVEATSQRYHLAHHPCAATRLRRWLWSRTLHCRSVSIASPPHDLLCWSLTLNFGVAFVICFC